MLSNQNQSPGPLHRRQMSTPMAWNPATASEYFPITYPTPSQQNASHRRGNSLNHPMRTQDTTITNPGTGNMNTNQGLQQQQIMRGAQMHGLSRPGQLNEFDDIFSTPSGIERVGKEFGDFESLRAGTGHIGVAGGLNAPGMTPPLLSPHPSQSRPRTPAARLITHDYQTTPHSGLPRQTHYFTQSSPIRPSSVDFGDTVHSHDMKRGSSFQDYVPIKRPQSQNENLASAPSTVPMRSCATFDMAPMSSDTLLDLAALELDFANCHAGYDSSNYSPTQTSPAMSSRVPSPELPPVMLFGEIAGGIPHFAPSNQASTPSSPSKTRTSSPRKKAQPLPEDMTIEDTGITSEQVDAFIQGPDPITNKFVCLFEGCKMGAFGRKENIRAHVQTHLGDRKYVCTVCSNKFVRPNDLKRHAIIHQEVKEYTCKCGAAFGRQDALRRHRIRKPYCVDGDPTLELMRKEEKKRGRPRKIAPTETNERRERKENIRKQVMAKKRNESVAPSMASTQKSGRSCSPEELGRPSAVGFSPGNMSLTPPDSPRHKDTAIFTSQLIASEYQVKSKSPSPPPTRGSMTSAFIHDGMDFGQDSAFNVDPFGPCSSAFSPSQSNAKSPSGSPPELDLSSSPPAPHYLDLSDPLDVDFNAPMEQPFSAYAQLASRHSFDDEDLFETNALMDEILRETKERPNVKPKDIFADEFEKALDLNEF